MMAFLYSVFVVPIQFLLEVCFSIVYRLTESKILAIVGISLFVNIACFPLYKKSDAIQDKEREKQKQMSRWVNHIKKNFKGDKKYMMLLNYYRLENYKPIYALRGSLSLLLQIPFFIAAYRFLSSDGLLNGISFLFIKDLGEPDKLFTIGSFGVNILPILMTAINLLSGYVYTRKYTVKEQIQLYITAAVFLVLLYTSPSGLVFYWTLNNLFSLFKNIYMVYFAKKLSARFVINNSSKKQKKERKTRTIQGLNLHKDKSDFIVILSCIYTTLFLGLHVPIDTISVSPSEFTYSTHGWVDILIHNSGVFLGFGLWIIFIYYMVNEKAKYYFSLWMFIIPLLLTGNYYYLSTNYGGITDDLVYNASPVFTISSTLKNTGEMLLVVLFLYFVYRFSKKISKAFISIMALSIALSICYNIMMIKKETGGVNSISYEQIDEPIITLSTNGQNVVFIMLDRSMGTYLPEIINEKPELAEIFDGFTYYPNTVSYGMSTNFATPSLFGGYEYRPLLLDERSDESLSSKQNEAMSVLPMLFSENNYEVTVCDPPYVGNYSIVPDVSYYDDMEHVNGYVTNGNVVNDTYRTYAPTFKTKQMHNFTAYCLFRCSPDLLRPLIYNDGNYNGVWDSCVSCSFLDSYCVLEELDNLTTIDEGDSNNLLMFQNGLTHEPCYLSAPDYVPDQISEYSVGAKKKAYSVHMAALLRLADWIEYMKENDVYDNTRIIIVSDHGHYYDETDYVYSLFNPLFLVKDFNSHGTLTADYQFMTNADVPSILLDGIIENPINPFTGNPINTDGKNDPIYVVETTHVNTLIYNGNTFDYEEGTWYKLNGQDIFAPDAWDYLGEDGHP